MTVAQTKADIRKRTGEIRVGKSYFLSSFYDKDGCIVKVQSKSTAINSAGWPSSVMVKVVEPIGGDMHKDWYAPGTIHRVNATNLYEQRYKSAASYKYRNFK